MVETAAAAPPQFQTRAPDLVLTSGRLSVALPILNSGGSTAMTMTVTSVTLGSAARLEPALPYVLGNLAAGNRIVLAAIMSATGLTSGSSYMLTARGTYQFSGRTLAFSLNRVVAIPQPTAPSTQFLAAHLQSTVDSVARTWSYALVNDEPSGSPRYLNAVSLEMVGPFTVTGTPAGWSVDTDNLTYVLWYAPDPSLPYPNHVSPGSTLTGFQVQPQSLVKTSEGRPYSITSWNHSTDLVDLVAFGTTLVPARS